jgi:hypothetical protein
MVGERKKIKKILCRVSKNDTWHNKLYRVSDVGHTTKFFKILNHSLQSACQRALGKYVFAECRIQGTRQSLFLN